MKFNKYLQPEKETVPSFKQLQNPFTSSVGVKLLYENRGLGFKYLSQASFSKKNFV